MAEEKEVLVTVSRVKDLVKSLDMRSGDEFVTALNDHVHAAIKSAAERCKANGRQTLKAEDI